jgi:hypothetical protein
MFKLRKKMLMRLFSGVWNEKEAWPLLFKAVNAIGALPLLDEVRPISIPNSVLETFTFNHSLATLMASRQHRWLRYR